MKAQSSSTVYAKGLWLLMEKARHESGQRLLAWGRTSLKSLDHLHLHVPSGDRLMAPMCSHWREAGRVMAIALGTLGIVCHWVGWIHASAFEHQDVGMFFWLNCSRFSTQFLKMEKMFFCCCCFFFDNILSWTAPWLFPQLVMGKGSVSKRWWQQGTGQEKLKKCYN